MMDISTENNEDFTASSLYGSKIIERFCKNEKVFIAGCICDRKDLDIVSYAVNASKDQKSILVPSEISEESLNEIMASVESRSLLFSECTPETDFGDVQVLIIDFLGSIPMIYHYCKYAYIGIGITRNEDNIKDAAAYGIPLAFRSKIYRKGQHAGIINHKIGTIVRNGKNLDSWLKILKCDEGAWADIHNTALEYVKEDSGAAD